MTHTPIMQFGTSRFLQAHADFFLSEALLRGQALGPVTVVQTTGNAARANRLAALAAPGGYPVRIRGLQSGTIVDKEYRVTSVARTLSTQTDWDEVVRVFVDDIQIVISNTSESGFHPKPADKSRSFDQAMSFPAKLTHLLWARQKANGAPIQIMPTELIVQNGKVLRDLVLSLAQNLSPDLASWISSEVTFVNSLVDRIVSEPIEPAGAVAEPYALWAVEDCPGLIAPCTHPSVQIVPSLEPYETQKLFILNLGHTYLVDGWIRNGRQGAQFVRDLMGTPEVRRDLEDLYQREIIPGFAASGMDVEARSYVQTILDRFSNPFLDHRLSDISQNHEEKIRRRIGAFMSWARNNGCRAPMPRLAEVLERNTLGR